jgi:hypothetical protein
MLGSRATRDFARDVVLEFVEQVADGEFGNGKIPLTSTLALAHDGGNATSLKKNFASSACKHAMQTNPSDFLRKKDASPQSSAGFPRSFSICELSCENFHTNFPATQAASSPDHQLELSQTMLACATSDEEMVGHIPNRQSLFIKLGGIPGRLAPNGFHAATSRASRSVKRSRN